MCATEVAYNFKEEASQNICNTNYSEKVYRYKKSNFQDYKYKLMQNFEHLPEYNGTRKSSVAVYSYV